MMQQFATPSSKLAVSTLPFDASQGSGSSGKSLDRLSYSASNDGRSAFEKAINDAESSAFVKANTLRANDQELLRTSVKDDATLAYTQPVESGSQSTRLDEEASERGNIDADFITEETSQTNLTEASEQVSNASDERTLIETEVNDTSQATDSLEQDNSSELDAITRAPIKTLENELSTEFDYVEFVSDIQALESNSKDITQDIASDEQSSDLLSISLTQEELQIVLDAQQAGVDLKDALSDEQLVKLSDAIAKMLEQFHQQNGAEDEDSSLRDSSELDADLMKTLIQASSQDTGMMLTETQQIASKQNVESESILEVNSGKADAITSLVRGESENTDAKPAQAKFEYSSNEVRTETYAHKLDTEATHATNKEQGALAQAFSQSERMPNGLETSVLSSSEPEISALFPSKLESSAQSLSKLESSVLYPSKLESSVLSPSEIESALLSPSELKNAVPPSSELDSQVNNKSLTLNVDANSDKAEQSRESLKQLALLDERSQTNTIENIKSRVEKFSADLGTQQKGSEFVAAMQSGLKEFKEQLQSGREPGIDLKALVSDALNQAGVEIPPQNTAKLDSALTQVSGLMNLASSVNQSAQAQAHQLFGLTETQFIKESNALHAEGTKLAQPNTSPMDKAVNIFKPEGQQQLAEKVRWMVNGRNPAAEIRLDPPELGAMQIRVNLNADAAAVSFTVQSAQAKEH